MKEYTDIYLKFLEREARVGLTPEEEGLKEFVRAILGSVVVDDAYNRGTEASEYEVENFIDSLVAFR